MSDQNQGGSLPSNNKPGDHNSSASDHADKEDLKDDDPKKYKESLDYGVNEDGHYQGADKVHISDSVGDFSEEGDKDTQSDEVENLLMLLGSNEESSGGGSLVQASYRSVDGDKHPMVEDMHLAIVPMGFHSSHELSCATKPTDLCLVDSPILGVVSANPEAALVHVDADDNAHKGKRKSKKKRELPVAIRQSLRI
ncbi:hypothetical protein ABZP36_032598 [Zizania latifolia]